ncbi:MAG: TIR domain-containing protein [Flavobacteriales bacterium]|nr:TIR domain-containing protein [Flavobacteriales bacterium]
MKNKPLENSCFFSYSRKDSDFVRKLGNDLRKKGAQFWLDILDILPGSLWDEEIEMALKNCSSTIIVLSSHSVTSKNVMDEVSFALSENKTVIPVLIEDCNIPFRLRRMQYIDFTKGYQQGMEKLMDVLQNLNSPYSESESSIDSKFEKPDTFKKFFSTNAKLLLALLSVILLFAFWIYYNHAHNNDVDDIITDSTEQTNSGFTIQDTIHERKINDSLIAQKRIEDSLHEIALLEAKKPRLNELYEGGTVFVLDKITQHGKVFTIHEKKMKWVEADMYCRKLNIEGHRDWYLPNNQDLLLLYTMKFINPFPNDYWSSDEQGQHDWHWTLREWLSKKNLIDPSSAGTGPESSNFIVAIRSF